MTHSRHNPAPGRAAYLDRDHHHPPVVAMWVVVFVGSAIFASMVYAVRTGIAVGLDEAVLLALRDPHDLSDAWGPPWFEDTAAELTALGGYPILTVVAVLVMAVLLLLRHGAAALFLAVALGGGTLLSTGLKSLFERPRPDLVEHLDRTFTSSFPSGHATVSMLAYLTLAAVAIRFVPRHSVRVFIPVSAFLLAIIIGGSRVYLGVHWPSDVIAGWAAGATWASLCWLAAHYWTERRATGDELGHSET